LTRNGADRVGAPGELDRARSQHAPLLTPMLMLVALATLAPHPRWSGRTPATGASSRHSGGRPARVAAVVPARTVPAVLSVVSQLVDQVDRVVVVDEGRGVTLPLDDIGGHPAVEVLTVPRGWGTVAARARRAGVEHALDRHSPDALFLVEPDAGAAPELLPAFLAALEGHDAVVPDCSPNISRTKTTPRLARRVIAALGHIVLNRSPAEGRCSMRLFSAEALRRVPLDSAGGDSDARHIEVMIARGLDVVRLPVTVGRGARLADRTR
jgi:hypothetical protein